MKTADIVIIGSGSLAGRIMNIFSCLGLGSLRIALIGRSQAKIAKLTLIANARAAACGNRMTFLPVEISQFKALAFSRVIRTLRPKVILQTASVQSPWESAEAQNAWTRLIAWAGFGITLPSQLVLASEISRGAADSEAAIINASYPDCVNPILHRLGLRVTCGLGNAAIIEAICRSMEKAKHPDVRVVAHHGHLSGWLQGTSSRPQPRLWLNGKEMKTIRFRPDLVSLGEDLNDVTSSSAVPLMLALLTGRTLCASVPGVAGMSGGYPFLIKQRKFSLRLPAGIALSDAIAHNKTGERFDGLDLGSDVKFVGQARESLVAVGFEYAEGFPPAEWPHVSERMLALRDRLRLQPA